MTAKTPAYDALAALSQRLHHFDHLRAIAGWD
jgi:carboxypeptidase Taq